MVNPAWSNSGQLKRAISSSEFPPGTAEGSTEAALQHNISCFPILLPSLPFPVSWFQTHSLGTHLPANLHVRLLSGEPTCHTFLLWVTASESACSSALSFFSCCWLSHGSVFGGLSQLICSLQSFLPSVSIMGLYHLIPFQKFILPRKTASKSTFHTSRCIRIFHGEHLICL